MNDDADGFRNMFIFRVHNKICNKDNNVAMYRLFNEFSCIRINTLQVYVGY